tara:strand:+ start:56 stop:259 length:204 start_codon:yes stop_codon:yes gene_type:complete
MMTEMTAPEIIDLVREYGAYCVIIDDARTDAAVRRCLKSEADEVLTTISAAILRMMSDDEVDADTKS